MGKLGMETFVTKLEGIRVKVCSKCQQNCYYCHKEGFSDSNEIDLGETLCALSYLRKELGLTNLKITGGEPTLFKKLPLFVKQAKSIGFENISVTTNGFFDEPLLELLKESGVSSLHFTITSLNPKTECLINGRTPSKQNLSLAKAKIDANKRNILTARNKFKCLINFPVNKFNKNEIGSAVAFGKKHGVDLRLLKLLGTEEKSSEAAINSFIKSKKLMLSRKNLVFPTSDAIYEYVNGTGKLFVKNKLPFQFFPSCSHCDMKQACWEGAYGIRLEDFPLKLRLCLQRNDKGDWLMPFEKFKNSDSMLFFKQCLRTT